MSAKASDAIVVFMTAANSEDARHIAETLVGAKLAACVQLLPQMESVYRWNDQVQRADEVLLLAKTTQSRFEELEREVRAIHAYEIPEIMAVPASEVSPPYLKWLIESVQPA
ncbi:MAG: divalent-cation tolerance protein CutA [Pyrinomonadaceae bacterium]